jgi:hypothetical protein
MNELKTVWQTLNAEEKIAMAERLDTHKDYLSQIAYGHRSPGKHFKIALLKDLRDLQSAAA